MVLDFGIGQGGALDGTPHHRLGAAVDLMGGDELVELGDDRRFGRIVHGGVAVGPVAQHAQAPELLGLGFDPPRGVLAAARAKFGLGDLVLAPPVGPKLLFDLPFDGQAVAVPAWHIVDVVAQSEARADDEILQQLVERVADMDRPVGVGRPIMQNVQRRARRLPGGSRFGIQITPSLQNTRLQLGQAATHGKRRLGKEDGFAIVAGAKFGVVGHQGSSQGHGQGDGPGARRTLERSRRVTPGA